MNWKEGQLDRGLSIRFKFFLWFLIWRNDLVIDNLFDYIYIIIRFSNQISFLFYLDLFRMVFCNFFFIFNLHKWVIYRNIVDEKLLLLLLLRNFEIFKQQAENKWSKVFFVRFLLLFFFFCIIAIFRVTIKEPWNNKESRWIQSAS